MIVTIFVLLCLATLAWFMAHRTKRRVVSSFALCCEKVYSTVQALLPMKSHDLAFVLEAAALPEMTSKIGLELSKSSFRKGADDLTSKWVVIADRGEGAKSVGGFFCLLPLLIKEDFPWKFHQNARTKNAMIGNSQQ